MTHFSKAELRLPTATPDRIYHKTRPNDLHTASLLNKIGVLFQIILLVLSLVFAFSAASAHPLLSENDQGDSHGSGSHSMPRKVSYQTPQQAPQPVSKSVSQPISRQASSCASHRASQRESHQIFHQALGGLKIVPVRSLSENRAGNSMNNSLDNSPGDNSDHYVRNGQNDALDDDQPLQGSHMQNQQAPIIEDALLLASKIDVEITGMIVHTTVTQTFKNQTADWIEGLYRFPLPDKAAVDSMTMLVGNRRIVGKIKEKEAARKTYANAVKAGKKAALLEEHRPNMFSSRVGNVAPGAIIAVELTFLSYAEQKGLNFSWTMPQAITPRFNFDMPMVDGDGISIAPGGMGHYAYNPEGPEITKGPANELASRSAVGLSSGFAQVGSGATDRSNPVHHRRNASINHQSKAAPDYENVKAQGVNPTSFHIRLNAGTVVKNLISSSHDLAVTYHGQGGVAAPGNGDDGIDATNLLRPRDVSSATNAVTVNNTGRFEPYKNGSDIGIYEIRLKDMALPGDRDFKLSWDLTPAATAKPILFRESAPLITRYAEVSGAEGVENISQRVVDNADYILGFVLPPKQSTGRYIPPRDVTFVIDTSGSMGGLSIRQAKTALLHAIDLLRPEDRFDIIEFNSVFSRLFGRSEMVNADTLARARRFVRRLEADGGTNMLPALSSALDMELSGNHNPEAERQILFLTDGAVGYEDAMFKLVEAKLGDARLFTVGIGSAPNGWFMRKAAEFGRGIHVSISDVATAGEELEALYNAMAAPSLSDLSLTGENTAVMESYPARLPDLFGDRPAVFIARIPTGTVSDQGPVDDLSGHSVSGSVSNSVGSSPDISNDISIDKFSDVSPDASRGGLTDDVIDGLRPFSFKGKTMLGQVWQADLDLASLPEGRGIAKMWARKKIEDLMDRRVRGMGPDLMKKDVLDVALTHEILSPFTSFVAVEEMVVRPGQDTLNKTSVKGNLPHGTEVRRFMGPRTATPLSFKFVSGFAALFVMVFLIFASRYPVAFGRFLQNSRRGQNAAKGGL